MLPLPSPAMNRVLQLLLLLCVGVALLAPTALAADGGGGVGFGGGNDNGVGVGPKTPVAKKKKGKKKAKKKLRVANGKTLVGIADQTGATFSDPLFTQLGVKNARLNLAWDALDYDWQVAELDDWMNRAHAAGVQPLVVFSQSRVKGRTRILPTPAQYGAMLDKLRARYPYLNEFAGWNEMNYPGQPTYKNPRAVAQYYKVLRTKCPGCQILPGSLLDNPNLVPWTQQLRKEIKKLRQPDPQLWGLHNYSDVNRLRDTSTQKLLRTVKGKIWLTETGGVVRATSPTASRYPQGSAFAGKVTAYILGTLTKQNPRLARTYLYEWKAPEGDVSWDSGLVSPQDTTRPAYDIVKTYVQTGKIARR